ncbi:putative bifunctional diguanylate cyclase/phosphodiesterase [Novosphingobium sp. Rr 2-17]|uniref:putative bifunctional diguanylate cyclase/phosphodiesterase n=1 Tax=Novosphingobium sp. Rr 2-17 TaxID=555793 RepID=UPI002351E80F|nr:EAL domain-containing protein [Novosphingobium sp. Rr 2-17]
MLVLVIGLLNWSGREVDRFAYERDRSTVSLLLRQTIARIGFAQRSSMVWDASAHELRRRPVNTAWFDPNLNVWFHDLAAIDEAYVLSPDDDIIYARRGRHRLVPAAYTPVAAAADPLVQRLRSILRTRISSPGGLPRMSPTHADYALLHGRPAIVSVKPIGSNIRMAAPTPGRDAIHVAVVYLDRGYLSRLGGHYGLDDVTYSRQPSALASAASVALIGRQGQTIGYFVWKPFAPGSRLIAAIGPILLLGMVVLTCVMYSLASRLARRTVDLEQSRLQAQHQATHDALTGLANRAMFEQRLDEALLRSRRSGAITALLYLDLDRFKQVNDTLGHPAGDALIRQVARRLVDEVRDYDVVARLGGDEFAIIISEPSGYSAIERICARIVAEIERPFDLSGSQAYIGASIGVSFAPQDGVDRIELTRKADIALYKAKMNGRSRFVLFTADLDEDVRSREANYRDLRQALDDPDRQFAVHYQPIFVAATGEMTGVEALLRWEHPELGLVTPGGFISAAEESGLIEVLGEWVLRRVLRDARAWPSLRVAVNVSPVQLRSRAFVDTVRSALDESGIAPGQLELELTETALMSASDEVGQALRDLRGLGIACALDDFGTGYSSLSHIRDFAVDRIKIDRSFVQAVDTVQGAALVEAIVSLASANGLRLTAEGVETEEQYAFLRRVGCEEVQGFLLGRPMPMRDVARILE